MIFRVTSRYKVGGASVDSSTTEIQPDVIHALRAHCDILGVREIDKVIITRIGSGEDTGDHSYPVTADTIALLNVNVTAHDFRVTEEVGNG